MLEIDKLNVNYGAIHALHDISIHVKEGEIEIGRASCRERVS